MDYYSQKKVDIQKIINLINEFYKILLNVIINKII